MSGNLVIICLSCELVTIVHLIQAYDLEFSTCSQQEQDMMTIHLTDVDSLRNVIAGTAPSGWPQLWCL